MSKPAARRHKAVPWKGTTTFFLKTTATQEEKEAIEVLAADRKRSDEVDMKKESQQDLQEWRVADAAEWQKVAASGE